MSSKTPTFSSLVKALHQTLYFISLFYFLIYFYYLFFSQLLNTSHSHFPPLSPSFSLSIFSSPILFLSVFSSPFVSPKLPTINHKPPTITHDFTEHFIYKSPIINHNTDKQKTNHINQIQPLFATQINPTHFDHRPVNEEESTATKIGLRRSTHQ